MEEHTRGRATLAWPLCGLTLLLIAATIVLVYVNRDSINALDEANAIEIVLPFSFAVLGGLVASRQPGNALGWLFLGIAFFNALPGTTLQYTHFATITWPDAPFSPWIPWIGYLASTAIYPAGLAAIALMLIPNGRLLSPRWRVAVWAGIIITGSEVLITALDPLGINVAGLGPVENPTAVGWMAGSSEGLPGTLAFLFGLVVIALAAASVVIRLRRARGEERLQLRWVAYAAAFAVGSNLAYTVVALTILPQAAVPASSTLVVIAAFGIALPAGFSVAILRYRLYDLDLLLNRTILYGAVTVVLVLAFGAADVLAQRALVSVFDQRSDLVAAALGLGAGLAFGPVRHWLRPIVDRALPARSRQVLLFTDVVESTKALVDLGDERWREVLDRYRAMVRDELSRWRGREINSAGDGFFATFDRPANGLRCAQSLREAVRELGLRVRTGIHVGEVEMRGEQISGLAVHAAARVMGEAEADQVLVTGELAQALAGETPGGLTLQEIGRRHLRGVPGEWRLLQAVNSVA